MEKVKIGVFGGYRGYSMIDQLFKENDATLVAVCDKYQPILDKVKRQADELGVKVALYTDFDEFIKHDMDAVVLANYANEHAPFAIRCLEAGLHVLSEVLPAETPAQAIALIEAVERTGKVYAYAENYCYMKAPFEMRKRYAAGEIGDAIYCEGEYIHDVSNIWVDRTYGERDHWRNRSYANFYCTHSVGPLLTITGSRPKTVVGFETVLNDTEKQKGIGLMRTAGIEMITLENGAICKSIHGNLKRDPHGANYQIYGKKGMMESKRYNDEEFNLYVESPDENVFCKGTWEKYEPVIEFQGDVAESVKGHGGSDYFPTHYFIEKILGREDGKWSIDVYTAVDMGLCGILGYRSVLAGNIPLTVPNFRNIEEREAYRYDNACTNPDIAGESLLPRTSYPEPEIDDSVYDRLRARWESKQK